MCYIRTCIILVIYLGFVVDSSDFFSNNTTRVRRQANNNPGNCKNTEFTCTTADCIDEDNECDGDVDCPDASDESDTCRKMNCPSYLFTCTYGACINKNLECDGKPDCRDGSDESTPECQQKEDPSSKCKSNEFRCSSGECIHEDFKCDGKAECKDNSDEIKATCWSVKCPGFTYRCAYGACVHRQAECNRIVDCFDASDEDPKKCGTSPTTITTTEAPLAPPVINSRGGCVLPQYPEAGSWSTYGIFGNYFKPGNLVSNGTTLKVSCAENYKLDGDSGLICDGGKWSQNIGRCLKVCPSRISTKTTRVTCKDKYKETENCINAFEGDLASIKCAPFYEDPGLTNEPIHICQNGTWSARDPHCTPVCGQKTVEATKLIVSGTNVSKGDYPWQVALYQKKQNPELICGGSLLSQRVILTAAHCITNQRGKKLSKERYMVAVGKYYREFNDSRDFNEAQFSELHDMFIPEEYQGESQNHFGDIAILITKSVFALSRRVQPVCYDSGGIHVVRDQDFGYVTGWGFTVEHSKPSNILKELKVPLVNINTCEENIPEDYEIYLTSDKMCAGYLDKELSVCKGDSGGGLVFKHGGRYYVTGIVSLSPNSPSAEGGCNSNQYGLYTNVSKYIPFILEKLAKFKT